MRSLGGVCCQQRFRAKNTRALRLEELTQFRREERRAVAAGIEVEQNPAIRLQKTRANVIQKEFPVFGRPFAQPSVRMTDPVKADAVSGHEIEFLRQIGQGNTWFDA